MRRSVTGKPYGSVARRSLCRGTAAVVLAGLAAICATHEATAQQATPKVIVIDIGKQEKDTPKKAVEIFDKIIEASKVRGPVYVIGYDSQTTNISAKTMQELTEKSMYNLLQKRQGQHSRYSEIMLKVDLSYFSDLPLGHAYTVERGGKPKRPFTFASAFVNGNRVDMKGTTFSDRDKSGKIIYLSLNGLIVLYPEEKETGADYYVRMYTEIEKMYDLAQSQFVPPVRR